MRGANLNNRVIGMVNVYTFGEKAICNGGNAWKQYGETKTKNRKYYKSLILSMFITICGLSWICVLFSFLRIV
jgi:hypothetical protein